MEIEAESGERLRIADASARVEDVHADDTAFGVVVGDDTIRDVLALDDHGIGQVESGGIRAAINPHARGLVLS